MEGIALLLQLIFHFAKKGSKQISVCLLFLLQWCHFLFWKEAAGCAAAKMQHSITCSVNTICYRGVVRRDDATQCRMVLFWCKTTITQATSDLLILHLALTSDALMKISRNMWEQALHTQLLTQVKRPQSSIIIPFAHKMNLDPCFFSFFHLTSRGWFCSFAPQS